MMREITRHTVPWRVGRAVCPRVLQQVFSQSICARGSKRMPPFIISF